MQQNIEEAEHEELYSLALGAERYKSGPALLNYKLF